MSTDLRFKIEDSYLLYLWIMKGLDGLNLPSHKRLIVSLACQDIVIEHYLGILNLLEKKIYSPAFALVRSVFETFVRGVWLGRCATDLQIEEYESDNLDIKFYILLDEIEKLPEYASKNLSGLKKIGWKAMNSYVHGGIQQAARRVSAGNITPAFVSEEVVEVIRLGETFALFAFIEIALSIERFDLISLATDKLYERELFVKK